MDNIDETHNPFEQEMRQSKQMQALFDRCVAVQFDTLKQLVDEQLARGQRAEQLLQGFNTLMITILTDNFLLYGLAKYAIQGEAEYYFHRPTPFSGDSGVSVDHTNHQLNNTFRETEQHCSVFFSCLYIV